MSSQYLFAASIVSEVQPPEFKLPIVQPKTRNPPVIHNSAGPSRRSTSPSSKPAPADDSSPTEHSSDEEAASNRNKGKALDRSSRPNSLAKSGSDSPARDANDEEVFSPKRPSKKAKKVESSSDSDSDDDTPESRRRRLARLKVTSSSLGSRGVRQPVKRGGKRF